MAFVLSIAVSPPASTQAAPPATFDASRVVEIEGMVLALRWIEPVGVGLLARGGDVWDIELGAIRDLMLTNVSRESLGIGTEILVAGFPARDGDTRLYATHLLLPQGSEIVLRPGLARRWSRAAVNIEKAPTYLDILMRAFTSNTQVQA